MSEVTVVRRWVVSGVFFLGLLSMCGGAREANAAPAGRDMVLEHELETRLGALAPDAVLLFQQGTAAMDAKDAETALARFSSVLAMAPSFSAAERRKCGALDALGRHDEAVTWCEAAVEAEASPYNQAALATVLIDGKGRPSKSAGARAKDLVGRATSAKPDDPYLWIATAQVGLAVGDPYLTEHAVDRLQVLAPHDPMTNFFAAIVAADLGQLDRAHTRLAQARADGLPKEMADGLLASLQAVQSKANDDPWWLTLGMWLGRAVAVWLAGLVLLLGAGYVLSRATLRAVAARPTEAHVRPTERRLRKTYGAVLWCASAYYYASLPLLAVVVVAAVAGGIGGILAAGYIAPKLFIVLAIVGFGSLTAIGKSLFVRVKDEDPGLLLDLKANPKMRAALDEVAARIGTRPVDRVFVTPFTEVAVFDRGSLGAQLRGGSSRCLILGAGVLDGMRLRAFKSVLAHEYGHFHNEDTAGGGFALAVRRSLLTMAVNLAAHGANSVVNPAWWFVRGFWRAFLGISQGASRLQEVLADRWAAFAYGSATFEEGLRHVIQRTVRFEAHVDATVGEVVKTRSPLPNLYAFAPAQAPAEGTLDKAIAQALGRKATPFDSHPSPADRLTHVRALGFEGIAATPLDDDEAWSLFADRGAIEAQMTAEIRERLRARKGVRIAAA